MMRRMENGRAMLLELTVALLFTALAACVVLSLFFESRKSAELSGYKADALMIAERCAEQLMAGDETLRALDDGAGFEEDGYFISIRKTREENDVGVYIFGTVAVSRDGQTLLTLPYGKSEAAP